MTVLYFSTLLQCLIPQGSDEIREFYVVVTPFRAHIAIDAGPYCLVCRAMAILSQYFLYYTARVKLRIIVSHGANHGAFPTVKAETDPGIDYSVLQIQH